MIFIKGFARVLMIVSVFVKTGSVLNMNKKKNMEFLAVFDLFWECKTHVHGWLAKPFVIDL